RAFPTRRSSDLDEHFREIVKDHLLVLLCRCGRQLLLGRLGTVEQPGVIGAADPAPCNQEGKQDKKNQNLAAQPLFSDLPFGAVLTGVGSVILNLVYHTLFSHFSACCADYAAKSKRVWLTRS